MAPSALERIESCAVALLKEKMARRIRGIFLLAR